MNRIIACAAIVSSIALLAAPTSRAAGVSYSEWRDYPKAYQVGYVIGILEYMMTFVSNDDEKERSLAYQRCVSESKLNGNTSVEMVKAYVSRTAEAATTPMVVNVLNTFRLACKSYLKGKK